MRSQLSFEPPTLLLDLCLEAGYTFAPFGVGINLEHSVVNIDWKISRPSLKV